MAMLGGFVCRSARRSGGPARHCPAHLFSAFRRPFALLAGATVLAAAGTAMARGGNCDATCTADLDGSGGVDVGDLVQVIVSWGAAGGSSDINQDGVVDVGDLVTVILGWGTECPPLANDSCTSPLPLNGTVTFCTANATTDSAPEPGCAFCCNDPQIHKDVWYTFSTSVFAASYLEQIDSCGSEFDTKIAVYRFNGVNGCACPGQSGTLIACNDDIGSGPWTLASRVRFQLSASSCYMVRVGGFGGASGSGTLYETAFVNGDECFNAIDLGTVTSSNALSVIGNNFPASNFTPGTIVAQAPCTPLPTAPMSGTSSRSAAAAK